MNSRRIGCRKLKLNLASSIVLASAQHELYVCLPSQLEARGRGEGICPRLGCAHTGPYLRGLELWAKKEVDGDGGICIKDAEKVEVMGSE